MATSIDALATVTKQNGGYLYRSDAWHGAYSNAATPAFEENPNMSSGANRRTYFNFTSSDVGKVAIWITSFASGFLGSVDLGDVTVWKTWNILGWTPLFSPSKDWDQELTEADNLVYTGMIAATKVITVDDVGGYYEFQNAVANTSDVYGVSSCAMATNLLVIDVKAKANQMQNPVPICSASWSSEKSLSASPARIARSSASVSGSTGLIEVAAITYKATGADMTNPSISFADSSRMKILPINSVVPSSNTSANGFAKGKVYYRFSRNAVGSYYNQPTFNADGNQYSCGGYAAIRIGG